jgi:hypothetical protein
MPLSRAIPLLCAVALLSSACAQAPTARSETYASGKEARELNISKVAIAPFRVADLYPRTGTRNVPGPEAAALVERFVTEALLKRGVRVVPAGDVRTALGLTPEMATPPPRIVAQVVNKEFGTPAVAYGTVYRMRERSPEAMGTTSAASVWFEVVVLKAPGGARLWKSSINETQRPLNENVFNAGRYPGGGMRWLSAEELARWGAGELAREFPYGSGADNQSPGRTRW